MKPNPLSKYFYFGTCVRFLQDVKEGYLIFGEGKVIENLNTVMEYIKNLNLSVTSRASYKLIDIIEALKKSEGNARLTKDQANLVSAEMTNIRMTLVAELQGSNVFYLLPKRYESEKLLNAVSSLFSGGVFERLTDVAQYDLNEMGKCIAFERPTAAAFHLMRATEDCLKHLCEKRCKRKKYQKMWGPMVNALRSVRRYSGDEYYQTLFSQLDTIRVSFRNPTQHPKKIYDINEVQDLLGICIDVITRIDRAIHAPV